jgi:hypothetical protein
MRTSPSGRRLIIIGENLHATRVIKRDGPSMTMTEAGRPAITFTDRDGTKRLLPLPERMLQAGAADEPRVKHIRAALLAGLAEATPDGRPAEAPGPDAATAQAYIETVAARQLAGGADFLDVNVDEVADDLLTRLAAMRWIVEVVSAVAGDVPLSLDSSSVDLLRVGLAAIPASAPRPLVNSASLERPEVLDLVVEGGCSVVLSAAAGTDLPSSGDAKVDACSRILETALTRGLTEGACHVDPLVLPVAVDPDNGAAYLEAIGRLRERFGAAVHLTGGLSNVSFGLPVRKVLNEAFIDLAVEAGADSAIVDPVAIDLARALDPDRSTEAYRLAADALTGRDPYCGAFLTAYRAGALAASVPA